MKVRTGGGLFAIGMKSPRELEEGAKDGPVNSAGISTKGYEGKQHATLSGSLTPSQEGAGSHFADWTCTGIQGSGPLAIVRNGVYQASDQTCPYAVQAPQVKSIIHEKYSGSAESASLLSLFSLFSLLS